MKKLLRFMKHYKKETVLAPLFKMLEASFELFVPLVMAAIVDVGIKNADIPYILKMGLVLVALAYPVYNRVLKKERERIAPEVLRLTEELLK